MAGYIPDEIVERVIASSDIVEVIGSFVPLKKTGRSYKALCPFHAEKTPSFVVNPERQIFHCFGCGEGGDVVSFLMKREHFTFPEAVRYLAERSGIPIMALAGGRGEERKLPLYEVHRMACDVFRQNLRSPEGTRAREYLRTRGIDEEAEEGFLLGYALPSWDGLLRALGSQGFSPSLLASAGLVIPRSWRGGYYDRFRDRLMIPIQDATGRVIGFGGRSLDGSEPKYLNSPETPIYRKGSH
ncbi:MAG: DNA primase, partial [Candidatus Methylomirabilales bacterium]